MIDEGLLIFYYLFSIIYYTEIVRFVLKLMVIRAFLRFKNNIIKCYI